MPLLKIRTYLINSGSFTGSLNGTSSYARRALTASYVMGGGGTGSSGTSGANGTSGSSGQSGTSGSSGASGTSGSSGTSGVGSPGTSGSSGASGTSGSSGTSVSVSGTTNQLVKFATASTLGATSTPIYESGSAFIGIGVTSSLVSRLQVYRSGSNVSVLKVDGGSGTLFEVTDNLSGSLFNVNDITGLPLFEVFSNNRIVAGKYAANDLVISGSRVGIGTATPSAKLQVIGNISGSQFTSSRRNAIGFLGTSSYARRSLTASFALNASSGGTTLRTGSTYPITSSFARRAITASYALASAGGGGSGTVSSGTTNRLAKYTGATTVGSSAVIYESGSAFVGIGVTSSLVSSLQVYRSGSNVSVLKVDGGSGTLFEVTDNLSGSLFNVNDITGLPIFEVFSNNRIVAGKYAANDLVISGSRVGIGTATPSAKLQVIGNISGSQFTSSRRNAVGFSGTASYARRALTASFALNASSGGTTLRTGSTYPITSSFARRAITASYALASAGGGGSGTVSSGTTNRLAKYTGATTVGQSFSPIFESGSAFVGVGPISTSLVSRLQVFRSGSNASVLKVDGGSGTLFEVTDNLSGSLFSVNTIAGFPILEVFSNNRMVAGAYGTNALVVSASSVGIGTTTPSAKLHIQGNVSGSQFTSSRRNAIGFLGTSSYARRALTASYALNASGGGGGSTLRTGSTYPITASKTSAIGAGTTNRFVKYNNASAVGQTFTPIFESGSAFIGIGAISSSLVSRLQVYRSGSNASVLKVDGGSGTLFEVTDNLSGSLFSVNTIAGFPILEVFSNNRMVAGAYGTNALVVSASSVGIGTSNPSAKLHVQGNISGSQFTSSRRNAIGFSGTASYARRALSASYVLGGAAGSSGTSGANGTSGTSGANGTSGTAGSSGTSSTATLQTGSIANQTLWTNVTSGSTNTITGLNLSSNKWNVNVVEEWDAATLDQYYNSCSLLCHFDTINSAGRFIDNSRNNFAITSSGNVGLSTSQYKFGGSSGLFDGTADYLTTKSDSSFGFGTGDYTIEAWVYPTSIRNGENLIYATDVTGGTSFGFNQTQVYIGARGVAYDLQVTYTVVANVWTHLAATRQSGTVRIFANGSLISSGTVTRNCPQGPGVIGDYPTLTGNGLTGYIDELRVTKGVARYTANFTPPNAPFPNSRNQVLTKYVGLVGGIDDKYVDYGVQKLSDSSLKLTRLTYPNQPIVGSGSLSGSVSRVYVNVLDYTKVSVTSSYATRAITASYALNASGGTAESFHPFLLA
jgi:collagen type VII alpha